jgi:hypothetical protein
VRIFRQIGDRWGVAWALNTSAMAWHDLGESGRGEAAAAEALALTREIGDRWGTAQAHAARGRMAADGGRREESVAAWRDALAIWAELGDKAGTAACTRALDDLLGPAPASGA